MLTQHDSKQRRRQQRDAGTMFQQESSKVTWALQGWQKHEMQRTLCTEGAQ